MKNPKARSNQPETIDLEGPLVSRRQVLSRFLIAAPVAAVLPALSTIAGLTGANAMAQTKTPPGGSPEVAGGTATGGIGVGGAGGKGGKGAGGKGGKGKGGKGEGGKGKGGKGGKGKGGKA